ncbi:hypothetical protein S7711_01775 [Stachybotrys chartarum IBT 7711]|uniref:Alpha N-terminal protein methyltransferase 1 n=1 Tax=Stachybotrys chartarum (strain CBS 109288 / IBT 7711) TaxID=1280523 RepID=A0A084AIX8_STACB|nr:hypothetical protein S7711_01775 [Stachybotrys chartarum IBT 7711]KFA47495.1 hypothetical protein S40293_02097 [Stachybotrys chartarum IBT 40293]
MPSSDAPKPGAMEQDPDSLIDARAGREYWQSVSADVNGMLGDIPSYKGFANISRIDLQGSRAFLAKLGIGAEPGQKVASAVDGGAGIGRITKGLLLRVAQEVDVIEPMVKFTQALKRQPGLRNVYNVGLEEWQPAEGIVYDLVWTQWCVGHLTDEQLVHFLEICKGVLRPDTGVIVVKENLATGGQDVYDGVDSSVTRQDSKYESIFKRAGLRIIKAEVQRDMPQTPTLTLYPVKMYALKA